MAEILSPSPWANRQEDVRKHPQPSIAERERLLSIIEEHAQRYSRGSVTRVALDNLALEIRERS